MAMRLDCASCGTALRITARHKGRSVTCRGCGGRVDVPPTLDFRSNTSAAIEDRKLAARYVMASYIGLLSCFIPVPFVVWWLVARRMGFARDQDRPVLSTYMHARVVCVVAILGHGVFWGRMWW